MKIRVKDLVCNTQRTRNLYFTYTTDAGVEVEMLPAPGHADRYFAQHNYGFVQYELTNHLGNVHTTISNRFGFKRELYPPVTVPEIGIGDWFASQVTAEGDGGGALLVSGGPGEVGFHLDQNNTAPQTLWFDIAGATTPLTVQCRDFYTDSLIAETTANNGSNVMLFRTPNPGAVTFSWNTPASQSFGISSVYMSTDIRSADIRSVNDYYSFGSLKPGRLINADKYSRGFNGMYKDDEIKGVGNSYTTEFRLLDPRLGRWLSPDALAYLAPGWTPYRTFFNNPIYWSDPNGLFESRKEARQHKKENDLDGRVRKNTDGTFSIDNKSAGTSIWRDEEFGVETAGLAEDRDPNNNSTPNRLTDFIGPPSVVARKLAFNYLANHTVGAYGEASWWLTVGGSDWGVVFTGEEGFNGYLTEKYGIRDEAVSAGLGAGILIYTGDRENFDLSLFEGTSWEVDVNLSIKIADVGTVISISTEADDYGHLLIMIGIQGSVGMGYPHPVPISGGGNRSETEILTD